MVEREEARSDSWRQSGGDQRDTSVEIPEAATSHILEQRQTQQAGPDEETDQRGTGYTENAETRLRGRDNQGKSRHQGEQDMMGQTEHRVYDAHVLAEERNLTHKIMALSIMLLWLVGCLLIQATPINKTKDAGKTIAPYPYADSRAMFEIIKEANKDIAVFLVGGDINVKHSRSAKVCPGCQWKKISKWNASFEISMFDTLMKEFEIMTCVQFVNRSNEQDYISIETGGGCWSYVGKVGGRQILSLDMPSCIKYTLVPHEFMHALGFFHEHTRPDRDQYIDVLWQNIAPSEHLYSGA
ncbi:low choriolytic enzyme-like [Rhinoderma darwinii]|uniref:low choriolytic enzyme-like n=1 Tax=Rhinoderma darwinii TaxID=43563 RepID=UPI003F662BED